MVKETNVLLVEDDFYARHMLELLLRRDWRTRVVGEVNNPAEIPSVLKQITSDKKHIDLILVDTDIPYDPNWLTETLLLLAKHSPSTPLLFIGMAPNIRVARCLKQTNFAGYVLKNEIRYALAWAVSLAADHHVVITPGVCDLFEDITPLPAGTLILDGQNLLAALSKPDAERARMAFIFSMERQELADELDRDEDYSYGIVSGLFTKIGLNDVLTGEVKPEQYFGNHPAVLIHVMEAIETIRKADEKARGKSPSARAVKQRGKPEREMMVKIIGKESLAFHLLTLPDIDEIT